MPKKESKKKDSEKKESKNNNYKLVFYLSVAILVLILFFIFKDNKTLDNTQVLKEEDLNIEELFNCEGKNTFQSDCWKKIQVIDKQLVYYIIPGMTQKIRFAFMNREEIKNSFSYTISSLRSADLTKESCPMPSQADSFILKGNEGQTDLNPNEISINEVIIQSPQINPPSSGCPYRYVLEVKKENLFYERTYFDIMIK